MAGYSIKDLKQVTTQEEAGLKQAIAEAWVTMKRTNWDDTKFCTINPNVVLSFSQAKCFQVFFENDGWKVQLKRKDRNYYFDVYNLTD